MTIEEFLDLLEEKTGLQPKRSGSGWKARCPVPSHDDREPSLTVHESPEAILVNCKAGCAQADVVSALDITFHDLFFHAVNYGEPEWVYPYTDEFGTTLFEKLRFPGKKFGQRHLENGEWVKNLDGVRRVLYRLPELLEAVRTGRTIFIMEGEKDVESMFAAGYVATCNPEGAGKWKDEYAAYFAGANVIIVADRDEVGRRHAHKVRDSLQGVAKAIWVVQAKIGKDVSDHLAAGLPVDALVPMRERTRRGLVSARELSEMALEDLELTDTDLPEYVPWEVMPGIVWRPGRAYAVAAYQGEGKTSGALQAFRTFCSKGHACDYHSLEMPERDLRNKLLAHKGIPIYMLERPWELKASPEMMTLYEEAIQELREWRFNINFDSAVTAEKIAETTIDTEAEVVFVDHLNRFSWGTERRKLEEQVNRLTNIALEQNVVVVILSQLRKFQRGRDFVAYPRPTMQDFRETSMIADDVSMAVAFWRQRNQDGLTFAGPTEAIILKNRHTSSPSDAQGFTYMPHFDPVRSMFVPVFNGEGWEE